MRQSTHQKEINADQVIGDGVEVGYSEIHCRGRAFPRDKLEKIALAMTMNPQIKIQLSADENDIQLRDAPTQIQLCPWFVEWLQGEKFKDQRHAIAGTIGRKLINAAGKSKYGFAQIGMYA